MKKVNERLKLHVLLDSVYRTYKRKKLYVLLDTRTKEASYNRSPWMNPGIFFKKT